MQTGRIKVVFKDYSPNQFYRMTSYNVCYTKLLRTFAEIFIDRSFESDNSPYRKPGTAMLTRYLAKGIDLDSSFVIGDRLTDIALAGNLGCRSIYVSDIPDDGADLSTTSWEEIARYLKKIPRRAAVSRKTNETMIDVSVNLDGTGNSNIDTGIGFLDHMLDQVARHGNIDIDLKAEGDLRVDAHHLTEDVITSYSIHYTKLYDTSCLWLSRSATIG